MATVIAFRRRLSIWKGAALRRAPSERSVARFWRRSMVSMSIGMGVIVILAAGTLFFGLNHGLLKHDWGMWVLVASVFSMVALTKVIIANIFFYILLQDEARPARPTSPPNPGVRAQPSRREASAQPARQQRRTGTLKHAATLRD